MISFGLQDPDLLQAALDLLFLSPRQEAFVPLFVFLSLFVFKKLSLCASALHGRLGPDRVVPLWSGHCLIFLVLAF